MLTGQKMTVDTLCLHLIRVVAFVMIVGLPRLVLFGHGVAATAAKRRLRGVILGATPGRQ